MQSLILASQSPRRKELLESAGLRFQVRTSPIDESLLEGEDPSAYVLRLATGKALAAQPAQGEVILGADTVVVIDGEILGKPRDAADAGRMLELLSGRRHEVITGVCLHSGTETVTEWESTKVWMCQLSADEIADYAASGEPVDKAGAYAIQGLASRFVEKIEGSYSNVVGLPIHLVYRLLKKL